MVTYRASEYNAPPLLTDQTGQPRCFFLIDQKNADLVEDSEILLPSCFVEFRLVVAKEKSKMSQLIRGHLVIIFFSIGLKNTDLVEDVDIWLPAKFR